MKLYFFKDKHGNFGDDLNPWFWSFFLGDCLDEDESKRVIGIGTLINFRLPRAEELHVMGSGVGYGELPDLQNLTVHFVRGPLSAERLNQPIEKGITDPAILVPTLHPDLQEKQYDFGFMPHCDSDRNGDWELACKAAGLKYISPRQNFKNVFDQMCQCKVLITEAMHGAIIADAYRIPFIPVKAYEHISEFKWKDWMLSMNLDFSFNRIAPLWYGESGKSAIDALKTKLKRVLVNLGIWSQNWSKPGPTKTSRKEFDAVVEQLKMLKTSQSFLSDDDVFNQQQQRMKNAIESAKASLSASIS